MDRSQRQHMSTAPGAGPGILQGAWNWVRDGSVEHVQLTQIAPGGQPSSPAMSGGRVSMGPAMGDRGAKTGNGPGPKTPEGVEPCRQSQGGSSDRASHYSATCACHYPGRQIAWGCNKAGYIPASPGVSEKIKGSISLYNNHVLGLRGSRPSSGVPGASVYVLLISICVIDVSNETL
jgi:hypothetical protein